MKIIMRMKDIFNFNRNKRSRVNVEYISELHKDVYARNLTRAFDTTCQNKAVQYNTGKWMYEEKIWKYYF